MIICSPSRGVDSGHCVVGARDGAAAALLSLMLTEKEKGIAAVAGLRGLNDFSPFWTHSSKEARIGDNF